MLAAKDGRIHRFDLLSHQRDPGAHILRLVIESSKLSEEFRITPPDIMGTVDRLEGRGP
jgi:hypothetical protein